MQKTTLPDFTRARSEETLLVMVKGACRRNRWYYDETLTSYRIAAQAFRKRGNKQAAQMFSAACRRQQELREPEQETAEGSLEDNLRRAIHEYQGNR